MALNRKTHRDMGIWLDNASNSLTDISTYINQQDLTRTIDMLESEGMGEEERAFLPGLAGTTLSINGQWDSTTDAIFGPLVADNTTNTKTAAFKSYSTRFYKGESWVNNLQLSGGRDTLETFSADLTFTGSMTRTSVIGS